MNDATLEKIYAMRTVSWITDLVSRMANSGKTPQDIASQLGFIENAFQSWREGHRFLPSQEPPFRWKKEDWNKFIADTKANTWYPEEDFPSLYDVYAE